MFISVKLLFVDVSRKLEQNCFQIYFDEISKIQCEPLFNLATTKIDLEWENTKEELQSFADKNHMKFFITTRGDWNSIDLMFKTTANDLVNKNPNGIAKE